MKMLKVGSLPLPKLMIVSKSYEVDECKRNGLPYIIWRGSNEDLVKLVMLPMLKKMFPYIKWKEHLGIKGRKQIIVHRPSNDLENDYGINEIPNELPGGSYADYSDDVKDTSTIADTYNYFEGGEQEWNDIGLNDYIGDKSAYVNIEELEELNLLPSFIGDITNCIKKNLSDVRWSEGYNKKRGLPLGNIEGINEARNLMILDVSGSIPRGVAATMISLIDTLRHQANADLIITSSHSEWFGLSDELPDPETIRNRFGLGNECYYFYKILKEHVYGRTWGNVIVFGDADAPTQFQTIYGVPENVNGLDYHIIINSDPLSRANTKVGALHCFHTTRKNIPGYGLWAEDFVDNKDIHYNNDWTRIIYDD